MANIKRALGWERRLYDLASETARRPFEWGQHDCCLWGADNLKALTLVDPGVPFFRGTYNSSFGARRRMWLFCGGGPRQVLERIAWLWRLPLAPCDSLQAGDPVCVAIDGAEVLGAIDISGTVISIVTPSGVGIAPVERGIIGMRVS